MTENKETDRDEGGERMDQIDKAFAEIQVYIGSEMESYRRDIPKAIGSLQIDEDFDSDIRNMLISFEDEGFALREFLRDEAESPRFYDLIRVWEMLNHLAQPGNYTRDELSRLYMSYSLCPVHHWDWAICFDDQEPDCAQVRAIFPHEHDT